MARTRPFALLGILGIFVATLAPAQSRSLESETRWHNAKKLLAAGSPGEAKGLLEGLVESYPADATLRVSLAIASLKLGDSAAAENHAQKAVEIAPANAAAVALLAWIHMELRRDYKSAAEQYARVVGLRPDSAEAHNNLAVALRKQGDLDKALTSFDRALELRPEYGAARSNRGWVYVAKKEWRKARGDFEVVLERDPQDEGALYGLARVLRETRDYSGSQAALSRLIAVSPNFVYWLEWGRVSLVRYYWAALAAALALFFYSRRKRRRGADGR
jgi:Tfp pilus assembly protein PilF